MARKINYVGVLLGQIMLTVTILASAGGVM